MRARTCAFRKGWPLITLLALTVTGCASLPPAAPVPGRPAPEVSPKPRPPERRVTVALLDEAQRLERRGEADRAASVLERALRIAPDDAEAWQRLAAIRLEQGDFRAAEELAKKSLRLAPRDAGLQTRNWTVIAGARRGLGDVEGALIAETRAREWAGNRP